MVALRIEIIFVMTIVRRSTLEGAPGGTSEVCLIIVVLLSSENPEKSWGFHCPFVVHEMSYPFHRKARDCIFFYYLILCW